MTFIGLATKYQCKWSSTHNIPLLPTSLEKLRKKGAGTLFAHVSSFSRPTFRNSFEENYQIWEFVLMLASRIQLIINKLLIGPDMDDLLQEGVTDAHGYFELSGHTSELSTIDPVLKIYHDCDDGIMVCSRSFYFLFYVNTIHHYVISCTLEIYRHRSTYL